MPKLLNTPIDGPMFLKQDNLLAISGSIKARGGIYEVLTFAEKIALEKGTIAVEDDYKKFDSNEFKSVFSNTNLSKDLPEI